MSSIGKIVKQRREAKGWSQRDLVRHTQNRVTQAKVAKLENGAQSNVTVETLEVLAAGLGCAVVDLLPEEYKHPHAA
jgi:transcriptional regulator with XRE-family HTH domain